MENTLKNLAKAFVGESQARNRYTIYARIAQKEGYEQLAEIFTMTAEQEKEHAKWLMRMINEIQEKMNKTQEDITVDVPVPTVVGASADNLKAAIGGENHEYTSMYPEFANQADKDGLEVIANRLRSIARAEQHHEERYKKFLKELEGGTVFKKSKETFWICRKCGYEHTGAMPPQRCPSCGHEIAYFEVKSEVY